MSSTLHKMQVVIEGNSSKLRQASRDAQQSVSRMTSAINENLKKIKSPAESINNDKSMRQLRNMQNLIKKTFSDGISGKAVESIRSYVKEAQLAAGIKVYSGDYQKLEQDITATEKELNRLQEKLAGMDESKRFVPTEEFKDLEGKIKTAQSALDKLLEQKRKMEKSGKAQILTEDYSEVSKHLSEAQGRYDELIAKQKEWQSLGVGTDNGAMKSLAEDIRETEREIAHLKGELDDLEQSGQVSVPTKDYEELSWEISKTRKKLEEYQEQRSQMLLDGSNKTESEVWEKTGLKIETARQKLAVYNAEKRAMQNTGKDTQFSGGLSNSSIGAAAEASISQIPAKIRQVNTSVMEAIRSIPGIGRVASEAAYIGSKAFKGMRTVLTGVSPAIRKVSGVFGALIRKFTSGIPIIRRFSGGVQNSNNSFGSGVGKLLKYGLGIRSLFTLFNKLRGAMVDGFQNLSKYSNTTNANLSTLTSGLTQLKNSLATAFAPILNVVTPILSTLIDYLVTACNAVAQFFAALTGQATYTTAKRVQQSYAASLGDTADAASGAAEQVKRSLMGFDEINKLEDSSGGNSGGSGGGSTGGAGGMFQDQTVTNQFANFAQMVKDAWANADFTEIGRIAGEKLNAALENIPWDKIKATCNKIAKSTATFLNGFIEGADWNLTGKTIAEGLNTGIGMAYTFVTTFKWDKLGDAIGSGINGVIKNIDWSQAGQTISESVKGILTTFNHAIQETDWYQLGENVKTAITSIDWSGIISEAAEAAGSIVGGAAAFVAGLLGDIPGAIRDYFMEKKEECGGSLVKGIFEGIKDALLNVGSWIEENILNPIVTGFENAFGIHSPSTVFAKLGEYCIQGLFEGLKKIPSGISDIAKSIWDGLKAAWDSFGEMVLSVEAEIKTTGQKLWGFVSGAWETVKNNTVVANVSAALKGGWDLVNTTLENLKKQAKNVTYTFRAKATGAWKTMKGYVSSVINKIKDKTANFTANARGAWDKVKNYVASFAQNIKDKAANYKATASGDWGGIARSAQTLYDSVKSKTAIFKAVASGAWDKISSVLNQAKNWLVDKAISWKITIPHFNLPHINLGTKTVNVLGKSIAIPTIDVRWYAKGGFPATGEMFVANEAGPELVGKMGRRTTVANQQQIISGIKTGVYEAVMAAFAYFAGTEKKQTPVFNIYVGGKKITDVVIEEVNNRTKSTGKCPILT